MWLFSLSLSLSPTSSHFLFRGKHAARFHPLPRRTHTMLLSRQATARLPARAAVPAGPSRPARGSAVAPLAAAVAAPPASLDVKSFKDGSSAGGTATLALSVAEADTAGAVVHRYIVLLRQNARAVSCFFGRGEGRGMRWRRWPSGDAGPAGVCGAAADVATGPAAEDAPRLPLRRVAARQAAHAPRKRVGLEREESA